MRLISAIGALSLLGTVLGADDYVPLHKRFTYDETNTVDDFTYLGMLSRRDACSDAFGSNARDSTCAPDFTLCCTRDTQTFPSCQQIMGKGWCCVGGDDSDKCYVDQESVCGQDSAVSCTNLQEGTTEACCPKLTTCDASLPASEGYVRCNINQGDLRVAAEAEESKAKSTSTSKTASSSTTISTTSSAEAETQTAEPTQTQEPAPKNGLSGGAIGGIAGGIVGGLATMAGLMFFLFRRIRTAKDEEPQLTIAQFYEQQQMKQQYGYSQKEISHDQYSGSPGGYTSTPPLNSSPVELAGVRDPVELDASHYRSS